jgi:hypothetical protein
MPCFIVLSLNISIFPWVCQLIDCRHIQRHSKEGRRTAGRKLPGRLNILGYDFDNDVVGHEILGLDLVLNEAVHVAADLTDLEKLKGVKGCGVASTDGRIPYTLFYGFGYYWIKGICG